MQARVVVYTRRIRGVLERAADLVVRCLQVPIQVRKHAQRAKQAKVSSNDDAPPDVRERFGNHVYQPRNKVGGVRRQFWNKVG